MNKIYIIQSMTTPMKGGSMYATNVITRDIRLQGDNVEKILVDYFKEIKNIKEKVSEISKEEIEGDLYEAFQITIGDVNNKISQIKQQADKIDLLVKTADNTSEVTITDRLINAVSDAIRITADNIDLNGYVSNRKVVDENGNETIIEGNWHIDEDGNAGFENLSVDKEFSCEKITVNEITSPKYPEVLTGNIDLYVNANTGNDNSELKDEAVYKTINALLSKLPKDLNGHLVTITLMTDISENVDIGYHNRGKIYLFFNGYSVKGWVRGYQCDCEFRVRGGNSITSTTYGSIIPSSLYKSELQNYSVCFQGNNYSSIEYVKIYGNKQDTYSSGIGSLEGGSVIVKNVEFYDIYNGVHVSRLAHLYASNTKGRAINVGWYAEEAGKIYLNDGTQTGGANKNTHKISAGEIYIEGTPPFQPGELPGENPENPGGGNPGSGDNPIMTKTVSYKSTSADTYRSTVYNNWKKDGTCRQGDYGYGDCNGIWLFGSQFNSLKDKVIESVKITITRQNGGYSDSRTAVIKMHNYTSRPSGMPTYISGWSKSVSLAVGETKTITITDSAVLNAIKSGTMKGFGVQSSYTKTSYMVLSGSCTVKITYKG